VTRFSGSETVNKGFLHQSKRGGGERSNRPLGCRITEEFWREFCKRGSRRARFGLRQGGRKVQEALFSGRSRRGTYVLAVYVPS